MIESNRPRNEEIDLFHFLKPIGDAGRKLGKGVGKYLDLLWTGKFIAITIVAIFVLLGISTRFWVPRLYQTEALFVSHVLPSSNCMLMIEKLDELKKAGANNDIVAQQMRINESAVADIKSIALTPVADTDTLFGHNNDTIFSLFRIELLLHKMNNIDTIQSGILYYLENSEYARKRKAAKIQSLLSLKEEIKSKMISLDTLKRLVNSSVVPRSEGRGIILGEPINPVDVYDAEKEYYKEQLKINEELAVIDNVEIISPFLKSNEPNYPKFRPIVLISLIIGLLVSLLVTPAIVYNRMKRNR